ncbi:MAG: hypothetical protein KKC51_14760 [Verrucomicrobia bacterium]|nr:hypothetical protein [Verrucomicrobiota bacterium]
MKKLLLVTLGVLSVVAIAFGQQVLSRNAVGYQQVTLTKGQLALIRHDFEELDTALAVSNVFASLPINTRVYLWNDTQTAYINIGRGAGGWGTQGSNELYRGRGFWVLVPASAVSNEYQVFLMGEVPDRFTAPTTTVAILPGIKLVGYPYPVEMKWTNTTLAKSAPIGTRLYIWGGNAYSNYGRGPGGWGSGTNVMLTPGMGFWVQLASLTNWSEAKPYTWP